MAQSTLERAKADGYIRVGFANEAPFGFATPDGKLTGEAPEVAKAVLAKMGIAQVDGVLTEFGSLIPGLKAGRFDIIAAGMFINPKRCAEINFSEPSYGIGQAMLVKEGNPKAIKDYSSFKDNADLKLAVMAGAVEGGYAKDAGVATLNIGLFINAVVKFTIIAFVLFLVVKAINSLKREAAAEPVETTPAPSKEEVLLTEIRDALRANPR